MTEITFPNIDNVVRKCIINYVSYLVGSPQTKLDQLAYTYYSNKGGPRTTGAPVQQIIINI